MLLFFKSTLALSHSFNDQKGRQVRDVLKAHLWKATVQTIMVGILDDGTSGVHLHAKKKNGSSSHAYDDTMAETPTAFSTWRIDLYVKQQCFPLEGISYGNPAIRHETQNPPNTGQGRINKNANGPRRLGLRSKTTAPTSETLRTTEANSTRPKYTETTTQTPGLPGSFSSKDTTRAGIPDQHRKPVKNKNKDGPCHTQSSINTLSEIQSKDSRGKVHEENQNLQKAQLTSKSAATDNGKKDDDDTGSVVTSKQEIANETCKESKSQAIPAIVHNQTIGGDQAVSKEHDAINVGDTKMPTNKNKDCTNSRTVDDSDNSVEKTIQRPQPSQEPRVDTVRPGGELHTQIRFDKPLCRR